MKVLFVLIFCCCSAVIFAQQKQFMLIVRSKTNINAPAEKIKTNIEHWGIYMGNLGKSGKIAAGYRPAQNGALITGVDKTAVANLYPNNGEVISSVLIINAADMEEAKKIAAECPVYELQGDVEVRPLQSIGN